MVLGQRGCKECGYIKTKDKLKLPQEEVKRIVESKNNNILLNPQDYVNSTTKNLKIICGSCGNERTVSLSSVVNSNGMCSECGHAYEGAKCRLSLDEVASRINNSGHGNTLLNVNDYKGHGVTNLRIRCSCGNEYITSLQNYLYNHVTRCQVCSQRESKGEQEVRKILEKYNISFITEYKYDDCVDKKPLPFDFYCCDYNSLIEFDG